MAGYGYHYPPGYPPLSQAEGGYPDHGDGFREYYGLGPLGEERDVGRQSRTKHRSRKHRESKHSRSRSRSIDDVRSRSNSRSKSKLRSKSRSRSRSRDRTRTVSLHRELSLKEPSFLDAFRVLYLSPSKQKKSTTKYLATKKRQDHVQELLKSDGLGSKRWLFYPRPNNRETPVDDVPGPRDNCDQRIKVDGHFFRKYKRSKKVDADAPIARLKRWELVLYKKLGFIQAV